MDRREALRRTAYLTGFAISASTVSGILSGCAADTELKWEPEFFDKIQYESISTLAEVIIPKTNTPGAKDVLVGRFVDKMCGQYLDVEESHFFKSELEIISAISISEFKKEISALTKDEGNMLMQKIIDRAKNMAVQETDSFFKKLKNLSMLGYFTSEEVSKNVLVFDPIPGDYEGCYPLSETKGRAWAI